MNIGIIGLGAIGTLIASQLFEKNEIYFISRTKKDRICIHTLEGIVDNLIVDRQWNTEEVEFDFAIVCVKEHHTKDVIALMKKVLTEKTVVVIIRNGIHLESSYEDFVQEKKILPVIINCSVEPTGVGCYLQKSKGRLFLPHKPVAHEFKTLLDSSLISVDIEEDFHSAAWIKLIESAAIGGVTCVEGKTIGSLKRKEDIEWIKALLLEGISVARADGALIDTSLADQLMVKILSYPDDKGSSMLTDRRLSRKIEIGAKNGCIATLARKYGISTPYHDRILKELELLNLELL